MKKYVDENGDMRYYGKAGWRCAVTLTAIN